MTNNLKAERTLTAEELQAIIDGCDEHLPSAKLPNMNVRTLKVMASMALQSLSTQQPMGEVSSIGFEEASENAWNFVKATLLERGKEKGYAGVWGDGFRQGWQAADRHQTAPNGTLTGPITPVEGRDFVVRRGVNIPLDNPHPDYALDPNQESGE